MSVSNLFRLTGFILFLCIGFSVFSQKTKTQLEQEKRDNLRRIAEAEKILNDTESEKEATLGQLRALNQQVNAREGLIESLNSEIRLLDGEIDDLSILVSALQNDLKNLKDEYASMVYSGYKANFGFSKLTFLFSASTFNELYLRLKYLEQYAEARKIQANKIEEVTIELGEQRNEVEIKRSEQRILLNQQLAENKKLIRLKTKQSSLVQDLSKKEKELRTELANRKQAVDRLDNLIADIVRKELERSKTLSSRVIANAEEVTASFEQNKNKLMWPVDGFISAKFGQQPHPVLKGITIDILGVEIQTSKQAVVRSVHPGEVISIAFTQGMNNVVIIQHGDYYTVYARLREVNVKRGEKIDKNHPIGVVYTDKNGVSELNFQVWKNIVKLNPEQWLSSK